MGGYMRKNAISEFKDYIFWGKNPYTIHHNFSFSVYDRRAIEHCILKAYPDMQFRTMKGLGKIPTSCKVDTKNKILNYLSQELQTYLVTGITKPFDDWHKSVCDRVSEIFKEHTGIILPFGKAQKLVNISFKYVYCLDDADLYSSKFQLCHMALDSIVLKWYAQSKIGKVSASNWSSIEYSDYIDIQIDIRKYCEEEKTFPLIKEFDVWLENMDSQ